jgi:hypothetical protein
VVLEGQRFEIPARYRNLEGVHLRYARWDLSLVDLVDPREGQRLCSIRPLDRTANASGQRKRLEPPQPAPQPLPQGGMAPLLQELIAEYSASGLPPAYLPTNSEEDA